MARPSVTLKLLAVTFGAEWPAKKGDGTRDTDGSDQVAHPNRMGERVNSRGILTCTSRVAARLGHMQFAELERREVSSVNDLEKAIAPAFAVKNWPVTSATSYRNSAFRWRGRADRRQPAARLHSRSAAPDQPARTPRLALHPCQVRRSRRPS
jgi:hypothetical protein